MPRFHFGVGEEKTQSPEQSRLRRLRAARIAFAVLAVLGVGAAAVAIANREPAVRVVGDVPARLADTTFWRMFSEMSEPDGYFRSDNLVSNEAAFQYVIPALEKVVKPGGVYVGVGPDQNFTYFAAFEPRIAFIVDIRRQNAMLHLMYKSLFELSNDRADFLSLLFSRRRPAGLDTNSSADELMRAYASQLADGDLRDTTMENVATHLRVTHGFPVTDEDFASIEFVHGAFYEGGPNLTYSTRQGFGSGLGRSGQFGSFARGMPTYAWLMEENDGQGVHRSYLASEANYRRVKDLQSRNMVVPVVGDFGGPDALRAVGRWLKAHDARVSVFYTSNVEQYLFQQEDAWKRFYANVATLPLDASSTFIRSVSDRRSLGRQNPNSRMMQLFLPVQTVLAAVDARKVRAYDDLIRLHRE